MIEGEAETQAEGEAGSMPGAWCRTRSRDSRIVPWAKGRHQTAEPSRDPKAQIFFFFNFYLFMIGTQWEREREAETQAEGEAGSMQGAPCGTRSRVSRTTPWAKGRHQTAEPSRDPHSFIFHIGLRKYHVHMREYNFMGKVVGVKFF